MCTTTFAASVFGIAPNNGRNCSVAPASAGQYAAATAQVAAMTAQFFSGLGNGVPVLKCTSESARTGQGEDRWHGGVIRRSRW